MPQPITDSLVGKSHEEKVLIKAQALVDRLQPHLPYAYTMGGVTITVTSVAVVGRALSVVLTAQDAGGALPVPDYAAGERFLFMNPPVMRRTGEDSAVEDPLTVAEQFVYDAVCAYARNRGWDG